MHFRIRIQTVPREMQNRNSCRRYGFAFHEVYYGDIFRCGGQISNHSRHANVMQIRPIFGIFELLSIIMTVVGPTFFVGRSV